MSRRSSTGAYTKKQLLAFFVAATICAFTSHASACSCFHLEFGFVGPYTSRLPANAIGIPWFVSTRAIRDLRDIFNESYLEIDEQRFVLEILDAGEYRRIQHRLVFVQEFNTQFDDYFIYHIMPYDKGLRPGTTYRVSESLKPTKYGMSVVDRQVVVEVDHQLLSSGTPLTLHIGSTKRENLRISADAQCSSYLLTSQAQVAARLPGELRKWEDQLLFRTFVDGKQWDAKASWCSHVAPGRSWGDVAHDRIFAACEPPDFKPSVPVLDPGVHTVSMEARLPGTDIILKSETKTLALTCEQ